MTITRIDIDATDTTAARFDALSYPVRMQLLHLIAESGGELCVKELTERLASVVQSVVTHHLLKMQEAGLLTSSKRGLKVYYALRPKAIKGMQHELDRLLWQHTKAAAEARRV